MNGTIYASDRRRDAYAHTGPDLDAHADSPVGNVPTRDVNECGQIARHSKCVLNWPCWRQRFHALSA